MAKRPSAGTAPTFATTGLLNKTIGEIRGRLQALNKERDNLVLELENIQASARNAIQMVGTALTSPGPRRGRPPGSAKKAKGTRKRRKMSKAARAKIAAAQRRRWAAQKAGKKTEKK